MCRIRNCFVTPQITMFSFDKVFEHPEITSLTNVMSVITIVTVENGSVELIIVVNIKSSSIYALDTSNTKQKFFFTYQVNELSFT